MVTKQNFTICTSLEEADQPEKNGKEAARECKIKCDCTEDERQDHAAVQQCAGGAVEAAV